MMSKLKSLTVWVAVMLASINMSFGGNKPLKVYILVGQSNMQGHARASTFPGMLVDPATKDLYQKFVDESGNAKVYEDVRVASLGSGNGPLTIGFGPKSDKFGPELGFGVTIYDRLQEPALIIKASWGGKNLSNDFRPPSAGPYEFGEKQMQNWSEERRKKEREIKAQIDSIVYSPEELELMEITISNGPYHYLGSAKIVGPIGEAFAKALIDSKQ